jgi:hypothetical protein
MSWLAIGLSFAVFYTVFCVLVYAFFEGSDQPRDRPQDWL